MILRCDSCGILPYVLVDGYPFGDRLLEGVMFEVEDIDGEPRTRGVVRDAEEYFNSLNTERWIDACTEFCADLDVAECPKCHSDVDVWGANIEHKNVKKGTFKVIKGLDFLNKFLGPKEA